MDDQAAMDSQAAPGGLFSRLRLSEQYRRDHQHPVNHFLHVGVGWPLAAAAVLLLPFHPLWSAGLFALAYAIMFTGHFVFEQNLPTVLKHPTTPFVVAGTVIRRLIGECCRLVNRTQDR
jgi:hypothetical protein